MQGRTEELGRCRRGLTAGGGVLVYGPEGIGKSTLLETLAAEAVRAGEVVRQTAPSPAEARVPGLGLIDLLGGQMSTVDNDQVALRLAITDALRRMGGERPVLLIIDNAQWLDRFSAEALGHAARRLSGSGVRILAAERVAAGAAVAHGGLCPRPADEIMLGPMPEAELRELIRLRVPSLGASTLDRIRRVCDGNPWHALEIARGVVGAEWAGDPGEPLPIPAHLRSAFATPPGKALLALRIIAAAARPGRELLPPNDPGLRAALDTGILVAGAGGALRFSHSIQAEIVLGDADPGQRREAHGALSALVADPVERAKHRALAAAQPDPDIARELSVAVGMARARGALGTAVTLARLATAHTTDPAVVIGRMLEAAEDAAAAGNLDDARAACQAVLRGHDSRARVSARLMLAELSPHDPAEVRRLLAAAGTEAAGDALLTARVRVMGAAIALRESGIGGASGDRSSGVDSIAAELAAAEAVARACGDPDLLLRALALRIPAEMQHDDGGEMPALTEAVGLARGARLRDAPILVRQGHAMALLRRGDTRAAANLISRLLAEVEGAGRTRDLCRVLYAATAIFDRSGRWRDAAEAAGRCGLLWTQVGLLPLAGLTMRGGAAFAVGELDRAEELLAVAIESAGDPEWMAYAHVLLGRVSRVRGAHAAAAVHLGRARETLHAMGYGDPAMVLIDADLAESLALSGDLYQARQIVQAAYAAARSRRRDAVLLGLDRAQALLDGLTGDPRIAADRLRALIPAEHPYPLEIAHCVLTLSTLERRARRRAAARQALRQAQIRFAAAGCTPWLRHTEERLRQLDSADAPVSEMDHRLIELVRAGVTNRAMAGALHLSVKAVEANLTRLYRRLGVSGRDELRTADLPH